MPPERWVRVKRVLQAALDHRAEALSAFLARECAGEEDVRRAVESLLGGDGHDSFAGPPASAIGSDVSLPRSTWTAGCRVGPYEVTDPIGTGAMGEVYRAHDARLGRQVAIKVLPRAVASDALRRGRFEQEARAAAALNHPNVVAVYDTGVHEGLPFIVTELLDGEPLSERVARGALPVREAVELALQVARGLVAAHERGIVHRDLKPANLFLTRQGQVKIIDFGVAKLSRRDDLLQGTAETVQATMPGLMLGTIGYMSPEQVQAGAVDLRSDQFSLGSVLYELLTGRPPFQRASAAQTMAAVIEDEPAPLMEQNVQVPIEVARVVERCMAKAPEHRYASTRDLERDLELALEWMEPGRPDVPVKPRPRPGLAVMIGTAFMVGCATAEWWGTPGSRSRGPRSGPAWAQPARHRARPRGSHAAPALNRSPLSGRRSTEFSRVLPPVCGRHESRRSPGTGLMLRS